MRRLICLLLAIALPLPGMAALSVPVEGAAIEVAQLAADAGEMPCHGDAAKASTAPDCCPDCEACAQACGAPAALPSPGAELDQFLDWHYEWLQTSADRLPPHRFVGLRPPITLPG